jgi:uncharacterized membrane protein
MKKLLWASFIILIVFAGVAMAQDVVAPELGASIEGLIASFGAGKVAIILAVTQLLKTDFLGNILGKIHKGLIPTTVLVLGLIVGAIEAQVAGGSLTTGILTGLFSGGFAIALYDVAVKHFVKKK